MGERTLLLGYDLGDEKTQMAIYNRETLEPELLGKTEENPDASLDTVIQLENTEPLTDFIPRMRNGEEIVVNGKKSNPVNVLAYYFRKTLSLTRQKYPGETIAQLVVTVADPTPAFVQLVYEALDTLGIGRERALVISHKQSFLYYTLYQKKELWVNDVGLFDYHGKQLKYYQMQVDRRKNPILVGTQEKDFSDAIMLAEKENERKAVIFENVALGAIHKQILSTIFMTGNGFLGDWADEVFRKLCVGRRLFRGNNLYVYGACFAAKEIGEKAKLQDYLLMDEDMISSHLSLKVYSEAKEQEIILAKAGTPWYQIDQAIDVVPDGESELCISSQNIFTREEKQFFIDLEPVSARIDRRCRIGIRIRFQDVNTCAITIKDKGFGELFPSTNRIWEKNVTIK